MLDTQDAADPLIAPLTRPLWTLTEAAQHCSVSRSTLRRYRDTGKLPNAVKDGERGWLVPVTDLIAAGLRPGRPLPGPDADPLLTDPAQPLGEQGQDLAHRVVELEHLLTLERAERRAAEQLAQERERSLADLRVALRMLEPARVMTDQVSSPTPASEPALGTLTEQRGEHPLSRGNENRAGQAEGLAASPTPAASGPERRRRWWQSGH